MSEVATRPTDRSPADAERGRRRLDRGLVIASAVIALGVGLIVWGVFTAQTGDDGVNRPAPIESVSPVENAIQVLQQESVIVDLQFGYEARLFIDGTELEITRLGEIEVAPGEQITIPPTAVFDVGNGVLTFTPSDDAAITSFTEGRHTATVYFWSLDDGPDQARSYTWSFNVV